MRLFKLMAIILVLLVWANNLSIAEGKSGYSMNIYVNNSTMSSSWSRAHITEVLTFHSESKLSGNGKSSKYLNIKGFAGIEMEDRTHTREGSLKAEDDIQLASDEEYVHINQIWDNDSEYYYGNINESMPTLLFNTNKIIYHGSGIYSSNKYQNDKDIISTRYYADNLVKSAKYAASFMNSNITVEITPAQVKEKVLTNSFLAFGLLSSSDRYSELRFGSEPFIEEFYTGSFEISRTIAKQYNSSTLHPWNDFANCCFANDDSAQKRIDWNENISN